jgi:ABC-type transport system substrate-binding protein
VAPLTQPKLVDIVGFGAEGGVYASRFGQITNSESGLETMLQLSPEALQRGITPDAAALALIEAASLHDANGRADLAGVLDDVQIAAGSEVRIAWRRPHLHPEAFLRLPLRQLTTSDRGAGLWFDRLPGEADAVVFRYARAASPEAAPGAPRFVVERLFADDSAALDALLRGEIDAVDRVPPWQLERIEQAPDVVVAQFALPTVHVLIPNRDHSLLNMREFRRAMCYGTDRAGIVDDILLGGQPREGFVPLSGPFPAGVSLNDPAGYGYNSDLAPRPYEPRLAALLAGVARTTLAKREVEERKARGEDVPPPDPTKDESLPPLEPLVLAHPADPLARVACQSLKLQLEGIGIPITLVELPADDPEATAAYDLLYAELAVWEPLTEARRLLGAEGVAGRASALMTAALDELDRSENWNDARSRLRAIHRIAHYDLPLIPLWQTVNSFAYRSWLSGVGERPLTLYQNMQDWRKDFDERQARNDRRGIRD